MSTLTVTNIKATGETASRAVSGVAAAWVNFNGTGTIAARDSNNVSSLTDNGTGDYDVNFTSSMNSGDYSTAGNSVIGSKLLNNFILTSDRSTTDARIRTLYQSNLLGGGDVYDGSDNCLQIFGDLA